MIGVSKRARKRYHKVDPDYPAMSKCHTNYIDNHYLDENEALLREERPGLKRCVNCWLREPGSRYALRAARKAAL